MNADKAVVWARVRRVQRQLRWGAFGMCLLLIWQYGLLWWPLGVFVIVAWPIPFLSFLALPVPLLMLDAISRWTSGAKWISAVCVVFWLGAPWCLLPDVIFPLLLMQSSRDSMLEAISVVLIAPALAYVYWSALRMIWLLLRYRNVLHAPPESLASSSGPEYTEM